MGANLKRTRKIWEAAKMAAKYTKTLKVSYPKRKTIQAKKSKKIKRKIVRRRPPSRTQLREIGGDIGIKTSGASYIRTKTVPYKPNSSRFWHTFEQANTFSFASSTGTVPGTNQLDRQKVFELVSYGKGTDLASLQNAIVNASTTAYINSNNFGVSGQTAAGSMIYQGIKGSFEFTNMEQANLLVTIYMCVAKINYPTYVPTNTTWDSSLDENAGNIRTTANVNAYMPDSRPTGDLFTKKWKIVKTTKIYMAAGVTQKHFFNHVVNKEVKTSDMTNYDQLANCTVSFLCTMRGTPVDFDAVQTHGPATLVGFAPSKIVGITNLKYTFKTVPVEVPKIKYQNNSLSGTAPLAVWELNDEDGKPVNIFAAANAA